MPSTSEKQRRFMGMELAKKRAGLPTKTYMSEQQLGEFAGSVHVHGGSMHEVIYLGEPQDVREVDTTQFGKDWEPRQFKDVIVGMEPFSHEKDEVKYGRLFQPGQKTHEVD